MTRGRLRDRHQKDLKNKLELLKIEKFEVDEQMQVNQDKRHYPLNVN